MSHGQGGYRAAPHGAVPAGYMGYAGGGVKMGKKGKMKKVKGMKVGKKPKMKKFKNKGHGGGGSSSSSSSSSSSGSSS